MLGLTAEDAEERKGELKLGKSTVPVKAIKAASRRDAEETFGLGVSTVSMKAMFSLAACPAIADL